MLKRILVASTIAFAAVGAQAIDQAQVDKSIALKDGSTVHTFKDGKMGMEDKYGRASHMSPGHAMETSDGKKIIMNGNEVWQVEHMLHRGNHHGS